MEKEIIDMKDFIDKHHVIGIPIRDENNRVITKYETEKVAKKIR